MRGSAARPAVAAVRSAAASCACARSLRQSGELGRCEVVVLARRSSRWAGPARSDSLCESELAERVERERVRPAPCSEKDWLELVEDEAGSSLRARRRGERPASSASQPPPHAHPTSLRATQSTMSTDRRAFKLKLLLASALLASLSPSHLLLLISPHRLTRPLTSVMPPNSRHGLPLPRARRRDCSRQPRPRRRLVPHVRRLLPLLPHRSRPLPPTACTRPLQRAAPS